MSRGEDLTGKRFGKLMVLGKYDVVPRKDGKGTRSRWSCKCDCGENCIVLRDNLVKLNTQSCGCLELENKFAKCEKRLVGKKFGRLTVIKRIDEQDGTDAKFLCKCDCGKDAIVFRSALDSGNTKSCGCLSKELTSERMKKYNDYEVQEDYVIMYTFKGEPFLVDLEDFWKVKDICWHIRSDGYVADCNSVLLHRVVTDCPDGLIPDHKHGEESRWDNRKSNLRIGTQSNNMMNKKIQSNNTSGVVGVSWDKRASKWIAYIKINGKQIYLGNYKDKNNAILARKAAEEKYFGEWSYDNSQNGEELKIGS